MRFVPLESSPDVFTNLGLSLGLPPSAEFVDIYSLSDPDLLSFVPRPVLAVILIFPISETYEKNRIAQDSKLPEYVSKKNDPVLWVPQTIGNACGTYALIHSAINSGLKFTPGSLLETLSTQFPNLSISERVKLLENSKELESLHESAAQQGSTKAPDANDTIDLHFVSFVSTYNQTTDTEKHLYELDGRRKGPIDLGPLSSSSQDILNDQVLKHIQDFINNDPSNPNFSVMALVNQQ